MDRILVVSFQQQSGKSTLALQLALAYQAQERSVVLMDYSSDQYALEALQQPQYKHIRGVSGGKGGVLSKVWAQEIRDDETVVIDTSLRMEQSRLDYLFRQVNSVLFLIDIGKVDLELFEEQFGEWIKRVRMVRSRLVVVATHCPHKQLMQVVRLRQQLDQFQIPLVMKLEGAADKEQVKSLAHMLLSDEMRVDSTSGNRLGRALHTATARAASMVGAIETLSGVAEEVKQAGIIEGIEEEMSYSDKRSEPVQKRTSPLEHLRKKNEMLKEINDRLRRL